MFSVALCVQQRPCLTASSAPASRSLAHGFAIFVVVNSFYLEKLRRAGFALLGRHCVPARAFASSLLDRFAASKAKKG
ncbi:hypothetical protein [Shewanella woodyi]|uniref:hypothetical protein n=1 Tax=Shewanella woodyi TaxID=60961 RepID=UPI003749DF44